MNSLHNPYMIVIFGPTAVGKTEISMAIADALPVEIVNMDVGQMYTPLSIGTAKPFWRLSTVPHHLFDILDNPINYTVAEYRILLLDTLHAIWARGKIPCLVGGSAFYLQSILFPIVRTEPAHLHMVEKNTSCLWSDLYKIDPHRALKIDQNDQYRLKRALAIWQATGKKPSQTQPCYNPPSSFVLFNIERNRNDLYQRINDRVTAMIEKGFIEEVKNLQKTDWKEFLMKKKLIGYDDLLVFCEKPDSQNLFMETVQKIQQKTRKYAKKQMTFWKKIERELSLSQTYDNVRKDGKIGIVRTINCTTTNNEHCKKKIIDMIPAQWLMQ